MPWLFKEIKRRDSVKPTMSDKSVGGSQWKNKQTNKLQNQIKEIPYNPKAYTTFSFLKGLQCIIHVHIGKFSTCERIIDSKAQGWTMCTHYLVFPKIIKKLLNQTWWSSGWWKNHTIVLLYIYLNKSYLSSNGNVVYLWGFKQVDKRNGDFPLVTHY